MLFPYWILHKGGSVYALLGLGSLNKSWFRDMHSYCLDLLCQKDYIPFE
jgi:hypothetical protein